MEGLNDNQMQQVRTMIGQNVVENNTIIGTFIREAADKTANMERLSQAMYLEIAAQTDRMNERVVELNDLKQVALNQTADLNRRSIEIEQKLVDIAEVDGGRHEPRRPHHEPWRVRRQVDLGSLGSPRSIDQ